MPMDVDGGLISCGGNGFGVMLLDPMSCVASQEIVWAIIRTPTAPDSQDMTRTLPAFSSRAGRLTASLAVESLAPGLPY